MNEMLFIFLILLFTLLLCSFLGGNCGKEGFDTTPTSTTTSTTKSPETVATPMTTPMTTPVPMTTPMPTQKSHKTMNTQFTLDDGSTLTILTENNPSSSTSTTPMPATTPMTTTPMGGLQKANVVNIGYDNYNHYSKASSPITNGTVYYDNIGNTATITTDYTGAQSISVQGVTVNGINPKPIIFTQTSQNSTMFQNNYGDIIANIFNNNGHPIIQFTLPTGVVQVFTQQPPTSQMAQTMTTSSQYFGSTGTPIQSSPYSLAYQTPMNPSTTTTMNPSTTTTMSPSTSTTMSPSTTTTMMNSSTSTTMNPSTMTTKKRRKCHKKTKPDSQSNWNSYYSNDEKHNDYNTNEKYNNEKYKKDEKYNDPLNSVAPAYSESNYGGFSKKSKSYPPCPPCARCPESSFECKKVPNYNSINDNLLPQPVLSDFSQFGM